MAFGWDDAIGIGASVLGGMFGSDSAGEAAAQQAEATKEANALQKEQYQQTRTDLAPYRALGSSATSKLAQLLGLGGGAYVPTADERNAIRAALLPQFTSTAQSAPVAAPAQTPAPFVLRNSNFGQNEPAADASTAAGAPVVDEAGLNAAIEKQLASMVPQTNPNAADYGSLLKNFSLDDFQADPSYQFRKQEGMNGLERSAAARGGLMSGAQLKALNRYNSDLASQEYGNAFSRDTANKQRTYNFLTGAVGTGQNSAAMTGQAGTNMANQVGANITANGSAQGAASIAQGNALSGALNGAASGYRQNQFLNNMADQNAFMRTVLGGNTSWRTTGNGMPYGYTGE